MSHHLDSPIARQDVRLDITDLYCFRGETGTALVINVCHSIAGPVPEPGFHPEGMYEFKVDLNGDAVEETTWRVNFEPRDANGHQRYVVRRIDGPDAVDPNAEGDLIAHGVTGDIVTSVSGYRVWAGQAGDPFWIEPDVLHAVGHAFQDGTPVELGTWNPASARNLFAGHTVYSLVLEIPDIELAPQASASQQVGVWAVATLATDAGGWRSINRVGLPMIHPLFTQFNEQLGDRLNAGRPADDFLTYGETIGKAVAGAVKANGTTDDPDAYAAMVVKRLLPNILPYKIGTPAMFGMAGWNGRSLNDNAPDVMFTLAANTPVKLHIGKDSVDPKPSTTFPYVPSV
jgi:hypothetical protein